MNADVLQGLAQAVLPSSLAATAVGVVLGLVVGMIPGMTISSGIIIVLPLTFVLDPNVSIALLLGLYVAGMTGGSFSAILLNIPGTPSASATAMVGYPMTRSGEPGRALGISITAGFAGGLFSFACLYFISPALADLALEFRAQDLFAVVLFGLTVICSFAARSLVKGLLSAVIGLLIVSVGQDPVMGTARFTFGDADLLSGIHFLTALIGLFAIPQILENLRAPRAGAAPASDASRHSVGRVLPRAGDLLRMRLPVAVGSAAGSFLGILPGAGGPIAAFISYDYAKKLRRRPGEFGEGAVEGIAAPEFANVFNVCIALLGVRLLVKVLHTPRALLMPLIAVLCVVGSYALRNSFFDVYVMLGFGLLGVAMRWLDVPVVPLLLALVLGRPLEEHLRVALTGSQGDLTVFFTSPFSVLFLALSVFSVAWSLWAARRPGAEAARR